MPPISRSFDVGCALLPLRGMIGRARRRVKCVAPRRCGERQGCPEALSRLRLPIARCGARNVAVPHEIPKPIGLRGGDHQSLQSAEVRTVVPRDSRLDGASTFDYVGAMYGYMEPLLTMSKTRRAASPAEPPYYGTPFFLPLHARDNKGMTKGACGSSLRQGNVKGVTEGALQS